MEYKLTRSQSELLKGFLVILIILGHNHILAPVGGKFFGFLYSFHIYGFFILPFLYDKKVSFNIQNILNIVVRNWIPYVFFFLFCYGIYHFYILKDGTNFLELFKALLNGGSTATKQTTGFIFLWFMPAYAAMSIVKIVFENSNSYVKGLIILTCMLLNLNLPFTFNTVFTNIPFAISQGFYYFSFGIITKLLLEHIPKVKSIGAIVFIILSLLYWFDIIEPIRYLFAISGFLFIYSIVDLLVKIPYLHFIGNFSFPIYLLHVIVYNILEIILPKTLIWGIVDFVLTISISLILSYFMVNVKYIQKLILPKNINELKTFYK